MTLSKKISFYKSSLLETHWVAHGFSPYFSINKKPLDLSFEGLDRNLFLDELKISSKELCEVKQVHGGEVRILKFRSEIQGFRKIECDGIITQEPGVIVAIRTADCIPLLLFDAPTKTVAAVHGGWRSCTQKIVVRAISMMEKEMGVEPQNLKVALGPGICPRCFEVGPDVIVRFERDFYTRKNEDKFLVDLYEAHKAQLLSSGVLVENIETLRYCTFHQENSFFSYRRDKTEKRHLNFIGIKGI
ncbi:MAG: peptidoglycan editing factor PgeF [Deltaproteobacteria bacterium]|nr:peptidoglycan editing factor PgeF [Deltaproteobacteria bacterium]